jgi:hypothetical protein
VSAQGPGDWAAALAEARAHLERGARALEGWLAAEEALWAQRPAPQAWSVAEVLEHVTLTQHFLLLLSEKLARRGLARAARGATPPAVPASTAALDALAAREFRWEHPEHMAPTGSATRAELRQRLRDQTARALALLDSVPRGEGALADARMGAIDARLDAYGFLHLYALHAERHLAQLERNANALRPDR